MIDVSVMSSPPAAVLAPVRRYVGERRGSGGRVVALGDAGRSILAGDACWGSHGRAADALAWALLHDATGSRMFADDWHRDLADEVIAHLPPDGFVLDAADLVDWLTAVPC